MRHRKKRTKSIRSGIQKSNNQLRNLLTSLIQHGQIKTTKRKAKVLKSKWDKFFAKLIRQFDKYEDEPEVRREIIREVKRVVYTKEAGQKVVEELVPKYKKEGRTSGFISDYKLGFRKGDGAEEILVKLV